MQFLTSAPNLWVRGSPDPPDPEFPSPCTPTFLKRVDQVNEVQNVWALAMRDRWRLYRYWVSLYRTHLKENIRDADRNFQMASNRMKVFADNFAISFV